MESQAPAEAPQRRKLNLKPRDESAASKAETERKSARSNPFGSAKPRESVLAAKLGKKEEDILKEELSKDKFSLRLTPDQNDEKQAAELAVKEAQDELEAETETSKKDALKTEIAERQEKLSTLVAGFEKMAIEKAKSGGGMRPSERRAQQLQQQGSGGYGEGAGPGQYGQQGGQYGQQGGGQRGYGGPESRGFDYGNARGKSGGNYEQPSGQYGGGRGGGGYDSYAQDAQPNGQSFGARGSGGFDNYNSKGGQSGGRGGREEGGGFGGGGGGRGYESNSYDAPAGEYTSPFTQDRF